jgi:Tol biopolymer transport system component
VSEAEHPLLADDSRGWVFYPTLSPDGRYAALYWNRKPKQKDGGPGLWLVSLENGSQNLLRQGTFMPFAWSRDGQKVYAGGPEEATRIYAIPVKGGAPEVVAVLPPGQVTGATMTPDGTRVVTSIVERMTDVWLLDGFDPAVR